MVALFGTTTRAAMLVSKGLLNTKVYLCRQSFTLPYILGFVTYFMAVIFSVFLWQLTAVQNCECLPPEPDPDDFHIANPGSSVSCVWTRGSPVLVELAIGIPIVILIGARFFVRWVGFCRFARVLRTFSGHFALCRASFWYRKLVRQPIFGSFLAVSFAVASYFAGAATPFQHSRAAVSR